MKSPIHSEKHYLQFPANTIGTGTRVTTTLVEGVQILNKNLASEVAEGAVVRAVYLEVWDINSVEEGTQVMAVYKVSRGANEMTFTEMNTLNSYSGKNNILFVSQGLTPNDGVSGPVCLYRGYIKIPKGKSRFALGEKLVLSISNSTSGTTTFCGFATYKEYL